MPVFLYKNNSLYNGFVACCIIIIALQGKDVFENMSIDKLTQHLNLTPYQMYIVEKNSYKYRMDCLIKRGSVLYAPYKCTLSRSWWDFFEKYIWGPRADLIGADRILVCDKRGIRLYPSGFYIAEDSFGHKYYADPKGYRIRRKDFYERV